MPIIVELLIRRRLNGETTAELRAYGRSVTPLASEQAVTINSTALLALSDSPDDYGAVLTSRVFPGPLREAWARARGQAEGAGASVHLRVLIQDDDPVGGLHALRWELLRDPGTNTPLAQQEGGSLARTVLSDSLHDPAPPSKPKLRALIAVAGPSDGQQRFGLADVDVAGEAARARQALGDIPADLLADTDPGAPGLATLENIKDGLRGGAQMLYLVCHGKQTEKDTTLYLAGDDWSAAPTTGEELATAISSLDARHRPLLAVLLACEGGSQEDAPLASVGPLLARAGVPAVIAMQAKISMAAAAKLTARLLRELDRDGRVDRALAASRAELSNEWWVPVLWLRMRDGNLWESQKSLARARLLLLQYAYDDAERICAEIISQDPTNVDAYLLAAVAMLRGKGADQVSEPPLMERIESCLRAAASSQNVTAWAIWGVVRYDYYLLSNSSMGEPKLPEIRQQLQSNTIPSLDHELFAMVRASRAALKFFGLHADRR